MAHALHWEVSRTMALVLRRFLAPLQLSRSSFSSLSLLGGS